jgi:hypothetical protein
LHLPENAGQSGESFPRAGEVAIMGSIFAGVLPEPLGGIDLGRVGWELVNFQPVPVGLEPAPDLSVLVIRGVVVNENGPAAALVRGQSMQEVQVGGSIEDRGLSIVEAGPPEFDRAQDLHALAFAADGDLGRMADPTPGRVQGGVLPETGFVGKNQRPVLGAGFFLRRG